jgi:hypothetical protein
MNHWHPYVRVWAGVVALLAFAYVLGSPIYLIALGSGLPSIQFIGAVMGLAVLVASVLAVPVFAIGALVILVSVRIWKYGKGKRHAA